MKAKCYRLDYNELGLSTLCVEKDKEIERLNNIIKEVREYINKIPTQPVIRVFKKELLEILDKVDKENNNEDKNK